MSERLPLLLLQDMFDAIRAIFDYTNGYSYDDFLDDRKTRDAVVRNLQILGEAANRVPAAIRTQHPDIEWNRIIRSRHILVHEYAGVDYEIVWRIIEVHLPPLESALSNILEN